MHIRGGQLTSNYGWEISWFNKIRDFSDGVIFFEFTVNWDRFLADHSPKFQLLWIVANYTIIEFNIYYLHHREEILDDRADSK